jgi:hypothetical protein
VNTEGTYEILNPWAETDPLPIKGLAPRLSDLEGKKIGLFRNDKRGSKPTMDALEKQLRTRYPKIQFIPFFRKGNISVADTEHLAEFEQWIKEIDGAIYAYGD